MHIGRRNLRKGLVAVGCLVGSVSLANAAISGVLILLGSILHFWSKGCLEQNRRLTTAGPYRWTRNPFYLGNLSIDLGLCFMIGRPVVAAIFLSLWCVTYRGTIEEEEARLAELFPRRYPAYQAAVPRLIPTGRRLAPSLAEGGFRFANRSLARGAEYARLLGIAIAPGAIIAAEMVRRHGARLFESDHAGQLAFVVVLPALWVVKLALAETFRRPSTVLVPWAKASGRRGVLTVLLGLVGLTLALKSLWLAVLPGLWAVLILLDVVGDRLHLDREDVIRSGWGYSSAVVVGSLAAFLCVAALSY